jgi:bifunctional non-homologous end joining protein LigD
MFRLRTLPAGFIPPCLPTSAPIPPSGDVWLHEIKHDGFRVIARKIGKRVKLYSRPGNDLTYRFPLIVEALARLRSRSCIIDGEAVACGDDGIARFDRIRYRHHDPTVFLYAFDLIELNQEDMRRDPLVVRKRTLAGLLTRPAPGIRFNDHMEEVGTVRPYSSMPASSALRVLCRSARIRATVPVGRRIGSRARIRMRQR